MLVGGQDAKNRKNPKSRPAELWTHWYNLWGFQPNKQHIHFHLEDQWRIQCLAFTILPTWPTLIHPSCLVVWPNTGQTELAPIRKASQMKLDVDLLEYAFDGELEATNIVHSLNFWSFIYSPIWQIGRKNDH